MNLLDEPEKNVNISIRCGDYRTHKTSLSMVATATCMASQSK